MFSVARILSALPWLVLVASSCVLISEVWSRKVDRYKAQLEDVSANNAIKESTIAALRSTLEQQRIVNTRTISSLSNANRKYREEVQDARNRETSLRGLIERLETNDTAFEECSNTLVPDELRGLLYNTPN